METKDRGENLNQKEDQKVENGDQGKRRKQTHPSENEGCDQESQLVSDGN